MAHDVLRWPMKTLGCLFAAIVILAALVSPGQSTAVAAGRKQKKVPRSSRSTAKNRSQALRELINAAANGDTKRVLELLKKGVNINAYIESHDLPLSGMTALMVASVHGHAETVRALVAAGANPNVTVFSPHAGEVTALTLTINSDHQHRLEITEMLIAAKAEINPKGRFVISPLMHAVDDLEMVKLLVAHGAQVNQKNFRGGTALMGAAVGGTAAVVRYLLEKGADANARDNDGNTALAYAQNRQGLLDAADQKEIIRILQTWPGP